MEILHNKGSVYGVTYKNVLDRGSKEVSKNIWEVIHKLCPSK